MFFLRNGTIFENNHIQVDIVEENPSYDYSMSLFLGNLSFKANEEQVCILFEIFVFLIKNFLKLDTRILSRLWRN